MLNQTFALIANSKYKKEIFLSYFIEMYIKNFTIIILANFHIESVKSMLKFVYIINIKYVKVGMSIIFIAWSSCSAGIRLDSIPAPYENFLPSIEQKHDNLVSPTPKSSPNQTQYTKIQAKLDFKINYDLRIINFVTKNKQFSINYRVLHIYNWY